MDWRAVAKLSLLRKSRNCVGLRGDWQLVTITRLFLLSKNKKKKTLMNPCSHENKDDVVFDVIIAISVNHCSYS